MELHEVPHPNMIEWHWTEDATGSVYRALWVRASDTVAIRLRVGGVVDLPEPVGWLTVPWTTRAGVRTSIVAWVEARVGEPVEVTPPPPPADV